MTALAMIIGMLPMSLGLGEGGEQNAPLGRAVIGGLLVATARHAFPRARRLRDSAQEGRHIAREDSLEEELHEPAPTHARLTTRSFIFPVMLIQFSMKPASRFLPLAFVLGGLATISVPALSPRLFAAEEARKQPNAERLSVNVVLAHPAQSGSELRLPASLQPFQEASIYARTDGYLAKWLVDIGDRVKAGQTLAIVDAPELDQQLNQARAALGTSQGQLRIRRARVRCVGKISAIKKPSPNRRWTKNKARSSPARPTSTPPKPMFPA